MPRCRRLVLLPTIALLLLAAPRTGIGEVSLQVANVTTVTGTLRPVEESEVIRATIPAGARITARCRGRKGFVPTLSMRAPGGSVTEGPAGAKAPAITAVAAGTGLHEFAVSTAGTDPGDYVLSLRWTAPKRHSGPGSVLDGTRTLSFGADAGSTAVVSVRSDRGATVDPELVSIEGPPTFGSVPLSGSRSGPVRLDAAGTYTVTALDGPGDGGAVVTVVLRPPKVKPTNVDVSSRVIGNGGSVQEGDFVLSAVIPPEGGDVGVEGPASFGLGGFNVGGTSVSFPAGAFPTDTVVVLGSGRPLDESTGRQNVGATVHFGPEGKTFGTPGAPVKALVTIPLTQSQIESNPKHIKIVVRDAAGRISQVSFTPEEIDAGYPDFRSNPGFVTFPVAHFSSYGAAQGKLRASDRWKDEQFGASLDYAGDTLVVNGGGVERGPRAYVFERVGQGEFRETAILRSDDISLSDNFSAAVATDGTTVAIGAPQFALPDGTGRIPTGYVKLYRKVRGVWTEEDHVTPSTGDWTFLGDRVGVSGDTLLAGASSYDVIRGAVFVFERSRDGQWNETAILRPSVTAPYTRFGEMFVFEGDTAVITSFLDTFVFTRKNGVWTETARLGVAGGVAVSGDTIIVGNGNANSARGNATVFVRDGDAWVQQAVLDVETDTVNRAFPRMLAFRGDTALFTEIDLDNDRGTVHVFRRTGTQWAYSEAIVPSIRFPGDFYGSALDFDERGLAFVGAQGDPHEVEMAQFGRAGSVFLLEMGK